MSSGRSCCICVSVIIAVSTGRKKVSMSLNGEAPVKEVIGAILLRAGDGDLLIAILNMGRSCGQSSFGCCVSDSTVCSIRKGHLSRRSTEPLYRGQ